MLTQYLADPKVPGTCLHNTSQWQVTELMGGLACELLRKERTVDAVEAQRLGLALKDCYPSLFMQGDEAFEFLAQLRAAQVEHDPQAIDSLLLSAYSDVVQ